MADRKLDYIPIVKEVMMYRVLQVCFCEKNRVVDLQLARLYKF